MADRATFRWQSDTLTTNLEKFPERLRHALGEIVKFEAARAEAFAKQNAPWTDRTGNARAGLRAESEEDGDTFRITVFHSVPYGYWLEVIQEGRFGIIPRTLREVGKETMNLATQAFRRLT